MAEVVENEIDQESLAAFKDAETKFGECQLSGDHDGAVRALEQALKENQYFVQTLESTLLSGTFEKLAVGYNTLGMKYLKLGRTDVSLKFFQKAEAVTDPANLHLNGGTRLVLRAVTYNNLGCFYKSMNKLHTALGYLKKALVIEERALINAQRIQAGNMSISQSQSSTQEPGMDAVTAASSTLTKPQNPAATHLNLCALLSQMALHEKALYHAQRALKFLEFEAPSKDKEAVPGQQKGESLIPVAYFNMAAEYEHLRYYDEALNAYASAHDACLDELGAGHPLTHKIAMSIRQVKKMMVALDAGKKGKK